MKVGGMISAATVPDHCRSTSALHSLRAPICTSSRAFDSHTGMRRSFIARSDHLFVSSNSSKKFPSSVSVAQLLFTHHLRVLIKAPSALASRVRLNAKATLPRSSDKRNIANLDVGRQRYNV